MRLSVVILIFLSSIRCTTAPPHIEPCTIINRDYARCTPTDAKKESYDLDIGRMRGYTALSADDLAELKKYLRRILSKAEAFGE